MKSLKEQLLNESKFGYTYENALVVTLKTLIDKGEEKTVNQILRQWFGHDDEARSLGVFLYHCGYDAKKICNEKTDGDLYKPDNLTEVIKSVKLSSKTDKLTIA